MKVDRRLIHVDELHSGSDRSSEMIQARLEADRGDSTEITDNVALGSLAIGARVSVTFELK